MEEEEGLDRVEREVWPCGGSGGGDKDSKTQSFLSHQKFKYIQLKYSFAERKKIIFFAFLF